jgi:hypothetical protein
MTWARYAEFFRIVKWVISTKLENTPQGTEIIAFSNVEKALYAHPKQQDDPETPIYLSTLATLLKHRGTKRPGYNASGNTTTR